MSNMIIDEMTDDAVIGYRWYKLMPDGTHVLEEEVKAQTYSTHLPGTKHLAIANRHAIRKKKSKARRARRKLKKMLTRYEN